MLDESTATQLEALCTAAISVLNQGDLLLQSAEAQRVLDHLAPRWEARLDNFPFTLSLDDLLAMWRENHESGAKLRGKVLHMGSQMREKERTASVFMHAELKGIGEGDVGVYFFCELKWKLTEGKWMCYSYTGMRKPCSDSGIVC